MSETILEDETATATARKVDRARLEVLCRDLLLAIGEDPDRAGLRDTPRRWASAFCEFIEYDDTNISTIFEQRGANQLVILGPVRVWSMCEHHLEKFWCDVWIGYIADGQVLGISKLARIAVLRAHRLQLQERLVEEIAATVQQMAGTQDVYVVARGEHLCLSSRGAQKAATMTSSALRGRFKHDTAMRAEFMTLAFHK